jgi:reverse transcriptase-like protein
VELSEKLRIAWARVKRDRRTDFVIGDFEYLVYDAHADSLLARLEEALNAGVEFGTAPLRSIRVPKETYSHTTRPGAVPEIDDRIVYQYLVDDVADAVEPSLVPIEEAVVHSYRYARDRGAAEMFVDLDTASYKTFQQRVSTIGEAHNFLVVADVADFYERLYHHVLENLLRGLDAPEETVASVMGVLRRMRRGKSYGIPQGIWPSDYLGNLYLDSVDKFLVRRGLDYCRYVDDIRIGVGSISEGERVLQTLEVHLEPMGLALNAGKTQIIPRTEIEATLMPYRERLDAIYEALRAAWLAASPYEISEEEIPAFDQAVTLASVVELFREQLGLPAPDPRILRFCVRQFRAFLADEVLDEILGNLDRLVAVTQAIVPYLNRIAYDTGHGSRVGEGVTNYLRSDKPAYDWQIMWLFQLLYRLPMVPPAALALAREKVLNGGRDHDAVTVSATLLLGKHGDHADREALVRIYDLETSVWVKRAILFAIQSLPVTQRNHFYSYCRGTDALTDRVIDYVRARHEGSSS